MSSLLLLLPAALPSIYSILSRTTPLVQFLLSFAMCLQSSIMLKKGEDSKVIKGEKRSEGFFLFVYVLLISYGGGMFLPILLGAPSSFITNSDALLPPAILAYILIFLAPASFVSVVFENRISTIFITALAQITRAGGLIGSTIKAHSMTSSSSTPYTPESNNILAIYPYITTLFPCIITGTLAGNIGPMFRNGVLKHFEGGIPWAWENGLLGTSFFVFYVYDVSGPLGNSLRHYVSTYFINSSASLDYFFEGGVSAMPNEVFAGCLISFVMAVIGVLQLDFIFGAKFNPCSGTVKSVLYVITFGFYNSSSGSGSGKEVRKVTTEKQKKVIPKPPGYKPDTDAVYGSGQKNKSKQQ